VGAAPASVAIVEAVGGAAPGIGGNPPNLKTKKRARRSVSHPGPNNQLVTWMQKNRRNHTC